jgi:unsaturated rhamnogalacturonyl hydrolase
MKLFWKLFLRAGMLLAVIHNLTMTARAQGVDLSGTTDDSIRNVVALVANHQIQAHNTSKGTLADGNYTQVYTTNAAHAATKPKGIEWEYGWGVTLYGLLQVKNVTGNTNFESYVVNHNLILARYYSWLMSLKNTVTNSAGVPANLGTFYSTTALGQFIQTLDRLDYCGSMTASVMEGALTHAGYVTNAQVMMALTTANWINTQQSRLPDSTLWRPERFNGTIWADDLYMGGSFLIRWYEYTGNTNYLDDVARQIINQASYLQDTDGTWFHGYYITNSTSNGHKWGRANGWVLVTEAEILSIMPTNHPARSNILSIFQRHVEGLKALQAPSGMWRQVLDEPTLWEETSCTAMFAYALARGANRGWIDRTNMDVARAAFAAVCKNISTNGVISNICTGTSIDSTLLYYVNRPKANDDQRGVGVVMLSGSEILLQPELNIATTETNVSVTWPAGIPHCSAQVTTTFSHWTAPASPLVIITNWQNQLTESPGDRAFYRLQMDEPAYPPAPLIFEAETLDWTTNGAAAQLSTTDINASGNFFVTLFGTSASDYIEFTVTNVPSGTFRLKMNFKSNTNRGYVNLSVDGSPLGGTLDEYWPTNYYPIVDFGPVNFVAPGDHALRFTLVGKSAASSGYTFTADSFIFEPQ